MDSLHKKATWKLVHLPDDKRALPCKWVYNLKLIANDGKSNYKARLVTKGFKQQQGVDFEEISSHIVKITSLCCILALATKEDM